MLPIIKVSKDVIEVLEARGISKEQAIGALADFKLGNPYLYEHIETYLGSIADLEARMKALDLIIFICCAIYSQMDCDEMDDDESDVWLVGPLDA